MCGSPNTRRGKCLQLVPSQQGLLECVLQTMSRGWMCILVGGAAVGKTSLARTAALLAGRQLTEITLTGGTDTADLLGGFEQLEPKRKVQVGSCSSQLLHDGHSCSRFRKRRVDGTRALLLVGCWLMSGDTLLM